MPFRRKSKADKAKQAVAEQANDRTDDLVAALEAAKEALAKASAAAGREGAELGAGLGKQASEAADKLMPERARQRRREAARKRNRRILAGAGVLTLVGVAASRLAGSKGKAEQGQPWQAGEPSGGWAQSGSDAGPASSAEVTQLHGDGASGDAARTPPS